MNFNEKEFDKILLCKYRFDDIMNEYKKQLKCINIAVDYSGGIAKVKTEWEPNYLGNLWPVYTSKPIYCYTVGELFNALDLSIKNYKLYKMNFKLKNLEKDFE